MQFLLKSRVTTAGPQPALLCSALLCSLSHAHRRCPHGRADPPAAAEAAPYRGPSIRFSPTGDRRDLTASPSSGRARSPSSLRHALPHRPRLTDPLPLHPVNSITRRGRGHSWVTGGDSWASPGLPCGAPGRGAVLLVPVYLGLGLQSSVPERVPVSRLGQTRRGGAREPDGAAPAVASASTPRSAATKRSQEGPQDAHHTGARARLGRCRGTGLGARPG